MKWPNSALPFFIFLFHLPSFVFSQEFSADLKQADQLFERHNYTEAVTIYEKWLPEIKRESGENDTLVYYEILEKAALCYYYTGQYDKAIPFAEENVRINKTVRQESNPKFATALNDLAQFNQRVRNYAAAEPLYLKALEIRKRTYGETTVDYADILYNLASLYFDMNKFSAAEPLYRHDLEIRKIVLGEEHPEYATSLNNLAGVYYEMGNYPAAVILLQQALEIMKKAFGEFSPEYALQSNNLGGLLHIMGNYSAAEPILRHALEIRKKILGEYHPDYALSLNNLASLCQDKGNYSEAEILFKQAIKIRGDTLGVDHPAYARSLNNLALLYQDMGYFSAAEPLFRHALEINRKALGENHLGTATNLNNLAMLFSRMGNYSAAEPLYLKALEIRKNDLGEEHPQYAVSLNNLAALYSAMGNYSAAEPLYLKTLEIRKKVFGENHPEYASSLNNLALSYQDMGNYSAAEPLCLQALEIMKKVLGENHPICATSLNNLAVLYFEMGKYAAAEPLYRQALEIRKNALGEKHPYYAQSLNNLAGLYRSMGNFAGAEPLYLHASQCLVNQLHAGYGFLSEREKVLFLSTLYHHFEIYNSFALVYKGENLGISLLSYDNELALKGASLLSSQHMRNSILESGDSSLISTFKQWTEIKDQLNDLYNQPVDQRWTSTDSLENVVNNMEKELTLGSHAFGDMQAALSVRWEDLRKKLHPDEAAIEFIDFRFYNDKKRTDSTLYVALITRPELNAPEFIPLFEEKQIYNELFHSDTTGRQVRRSITPEIQSELFNLVWQPLERSLESVTTVYISPAGLLNMVPFHALRDSNNFTLIDKVNLRWLLSTRQLAMQPLQENHQSQKTAALFGGINYNTESELLVKETLPEGEYAQRSYFQNDSSRAVTSFSYLPGTLREVEKINGTLAGKKWVTTVFSGNEATEAHFKRLSGNNAPLVLHLATHGFYFPLQEKKQDEFKPVSLDLNQYRVSQDPLRRTGLVLSGANHAWKGESLPPGVEDGIVTACEISNMDLRKTELVILSACQTGLGDIKAGEGVFGLQRAFRLAGVQTIIMSLWEVDDTSTAELMESFFGFWTSGDDKVTAFTKATKELRSKYPDEPRKWAAFVLVE